MKRYEGLFILNLAGREDGLDEAVEKVKSILTGAGATVHTVQKMEKRPFVRVTDKKVTAGHYVNFIFEASPEVIASMPGHFTLVEEVYRVQLSAVPKMVHPAPAPLAAA